MKGNKFDFIKRFKDLVKKVDNEEIAIGDACYEIEGGLAMGSLRADARLNEIMIEAGELREQKRNIKEQWLKLKSKIEAL